MRKWLVALVLLTACGPGSAQPIPSLPPPSPPTAALTAWKDFPANANRPAVKMIWYDGGKKPSPELFEGEQVSETGVLLIGDKGKLFAPGDYCEKGYKVLGGGTDPAGD